jgi:hypothetical protein
MRAEPSFERVQLLRAAPAPEAPALRRANPGTYVEDEPDERKSALGGFVRLLVFLVVMCMVGVTLAVVWRVTGSQGGARLWPALAAQLSPTTDAGAPAGELDRVVKELAALKATVGELSAVQQQISATLATLQAAEEKLRSAQDDLQQRTTSLPPTPSGSAAVSNALRLNAPPPAATAATPAPRAAQTPRFAPPPAPAQSAAPTSPPSANPPGMIRP